MTTAADSAARQVPHGESERERPQAYAGTEVAESRSGTSSHLPVFAAFDELGLTSRDVAAFAGVTPPTVSKWRSGKASIGGDRLAFLTLVLAHLLDEARAMVALEDQCAGEQGAWGSAWSARLDSARAYLAYQDVLSRDMDVADVREGALMFRAWWASGAAKRLQEKRFSPRLDGDVELRNEQGQTVRHGT